MWIVIEGGGILDEERKEGGSVSLRCGHDASWPASSVHTRWNSSTDRSAGDSPATGTGYVTGIRSNTPRVESLRTT